MSDDTAFDEELYKEHFRVTIFGSARIKEEDPIYQEIYELSKKIAAENIDVVTGGGPGLMAAANKGHKDGRKSDDVQSIGLNIVLPHEQQANRHLDIKREFEKFSERLDHFMKLSNAIIVAPGGVGTLLEFFYAWQLIQVKKKEHIPIIMLGDMWPELLKWIEYYPLNRKLLDVQDINHIQVAKTIDEAFAIIKNYHERFKRGEK
ncbi:MAG: LOG family protein [Thermoplasmata archaeon]|nr:LOG family protein [Thermoplasmata archaeon]